jgi:hypothetical protein
MLVQYFVKTGECRYGAKCRFNHPKDKSQPSSTDDQAATATATATATTAAAFATLPVKPATSFNSKGLPVRPVSDRPPFTFCATSGYGVKMWVRD